MVRSKTITWLRVGEGGLQDRGVGGKPSPHSQTLSFCRCWIKIKLCGTENATLICFLFPGVSKIPNQVCMWCFHLEEPLILCNDHLHHGSQSRSDSDVHWVVDCFWLPKLCNGDFDIVKNRIVRNWWQIISIFQTLTTLGVITMARLLAVILFCSLYVVTRLRNCKQGVKRSYFKPRLEENLEQVLDILVILSWQVLMLKKVPDGIKFIVTLLWGRGDNNSISTKRYNYRRIWEDLIIQKW